MQASSMKALFALLPLVALAACGPQYDRYDEPPTVPVCPSWEPRPGSWCAQATTCYYPPSDGCSSYVQASCVDHAWWVSSEGCGKDAGPDVSTDTSTGTCPTAEPAIGAACTGSLSCSYTNLCPLVSVKSNAYRCIGGKWTFEDSALAPADCPKVQPHDGEACGCAMYLPARCSYTTAKCSIDALCDGATQRWKVPSCATDAGTDASAETGTDASAEASTDASAETSTDAASSETATDAATEASADASTSPDATDAAVADAASD